MKKPTDVEIGNMIKVVLLICRTLVIIGKAIKHNDAPLREDSITSDIKKTLGSLK